MPSLRRDKTFIVAPIVLAFVCLIAFASKKKETRNVPQMEESKRALHALQRLSVGCDSACLLSAVLLHELREGEGCREGGDDNRCG